MPPKSEDPTLDIHKLKDETTSSDSSTNDENEEQATVSTAKLKYIIFFDKHTVEILADKVVEVNEQSGMLDFKAVLARDARRSLDSLGMVEIMRAVIFITSFCMISTLKLVLCLKSYLFVRLYISLYSNSRIFYSHFIMILTVPNFQLGMS